ncbi:MAG: hypothetical protein V4582_19775 [Pseudomonadota bacterium]
MFETTTIRLPCHVYAALLQAMQATRDARTPEHIVELALQVWMRDAFKTARPPTAPAIRGYQWKSLFLPDGSLLRMCYRGRQYYAEVRGDALEFMGRAMSPRQIAMHVTGSVRNAWQTFWIRSPGDAMWHLADTRRRILRRVLPAPAPHDTPMRAWWRNRILHRADIVRADQPELDRPPGAPRLGAYVPGRPGPRERRRSQLAAAPPPAAPPTPAPPAP